MEIKCCWEKKKKHKNYCPCPPEFTVEEETKIEQVITKPARNYCCAQRCREEQPGH